MKRKMNLSKKTTIAPRNPVAKGMLSTLKPKVVQSKVNLGVKKNKKALRKKPGIDSSSE